MPITVTGLEVPFGSVFFFTLKAVIALIPIFLLLTFIGLICTVIFGSCGLFFTSQVLQ